MIPWLDLWLFSSYKEEKSGLGMEATWQVHPSPPARAETNTNFFL